MTRHLLPLAVFASAVALSIGLAASGRATEPATTPNTVVDSHTEPTELAIVWTSGDPEVAHRMTLMYTHAAKKAGWFENVRLVVWGPSSRLLAADKDLQEKIAAMKADGVLVQACVVCANSYGVADDLRGQDIEVLPMGGPLTKLAKDPNVSVMTF